MIGNASTNDYSAPAPYEVNKVKKGYDYWVTMLTEKCLGMYEYTGLPASLPAAQIELRLIQRGYCVVFKGRKTAVNGIRQDEKLYTAFGGLSGVDEYYLPTNWIYAQPALESGNRTLHKDAEIIYNTQADMYRRRGLYDIIRRYARMLADADSSINIFTVNTRAMKMNVAASKQVANTVDNAMKKMADGEMYTINTNSILELYKALDWNIAKPNQLTELIDSRERLLASFMAEIGVKSALNKRERMITDEVAADDQLLTVNVDDMLKSRQEGIERINKLFGTNITVKRSEAYELQKTAEKAGGNNVDE